jgi:hypothetical protein
MSSGCTQPAAVSRHEYRPDIGSAWIDELVRGVVDQRSVDQVTRHELEWGDAIEVWPSADPAAIFLGVTDADTDQAATAALSVDEAQRIGAQLMSAAYEKRGR